jgi:hypothetical protein
MATWASLATYVHSHYKVATENEGMMALDFDLGNARTQRVMLFKATLLDGLEEWVQIESAIGKANEVDISAAVDATENMTCGGIAKLGELITFRHSLPLADLQISEFERPLQLVTSTADQLEAKLTGADIF